MPAKGSGSGRVKGSPMLTVRLATDEKERVSGYARSIKTTEAELTRHALNKLEPRLRLATKLSKLTQESG